MNSDSAFCIAISGGMVLCYHMKADSNVISKNTVSLETQAALWAFLGVLAFSFTLPATRIAAPALGGFTVGIGRAIIAAVLAALVLYLRREKLPERRHWLGLGLVALGCVFGFPVLSSTALQFVDSSHGSITNGLLPAASAVAAVLFARERPHWSFWLVCVAGVLAAVLYGISRGAGGLQLGDLLMLLAVAMGAIGYAEGGRLARELEGWRVISWALVFSVPLLLVSFPFAVSSHAVTLSPLVVACFLYVAVFSMYLGFFAWYKGLAMGSIAKTGQVQLVQTPLTLLWSGLLLGEHLDPVTLSAGGLMVGVVVLSRFTRVMR
jgi:drug/metabolite transporter (DMT)-like permease